MEELTHIYGFGPQTVARLQAAVPPQALTLANLRQSAGARGLSARSPHTRALARALRNGRRHGQPTFMQTVGLRYHGRWRGAVSRHEMGSIVREIARRWRESLGERLGITVCGSYRRGSRTSNDVDLVVRHMGPGPTPLTAADLLAPLRRGGFVPADGDLVRHPVVRYMGFCRLPGHRWFRRLDIVWVPTNDRAQLPATVLALTGSADFNRALRNRARELGIRLGSNSLRWADDTDSSPFPYAILRTERDIFRLLGVPYLAPQDR